MRAENLSEGKRQLEYYYVKYSDIDLALGAYDGHVKTRAQRERSKVSWIRCW